MATRRLLHHSGIEGITEGTFEMKNKRVWMLAGLIVCTIAGWLILMIDPVWQKDQRPDKTVSEPFSGDLGRESPVPALMTVARKLKKSYPDERRNYGNSSLQRLCLIGFHSATREAAAEAYGKPSVAAGFSWRNKRRGEDAGNPERRVYIHSDFILASGDREGDGPGRAAIQ